MQMCCLRARRVRLSGAVVLGCEPRLVCLSCVTWAVLLWVARWRHPRSLSLGPTYSVAEQNGWNRSTKVSRACMFESHNPSKRTAHCSSTPMSYVHTHHASHGRYSMSKCLFCANAARNCVHCRRPPVDRAAMANAASSPVSLAAPLICRATNQHTRRHRVSKRCHIPPHTAHHTSRATHLVLERVPDEVQHAGEGDILGHVQPHRTLHAPKRQHVCAVVAFATACRRPPARTAGHTPSHVGHALRVQAPSQRRHRVDDERHAGRGVEGVAHGRRSFQRRQAAWAQACGRRRSRWRWHRLGGGSVSRGPPRRGSWERVGGRQVYGSRAAAFAAFAGAHRRHFAAARRSDSHTGRVVVHVCTSGGGGSSTRQRFGGRASGHSGSIAARWYRRTEGVVATKCGRR